MPEEAKRIVSLIVQQARQAQSDSEDTTDRPLKGAQAQPGQIVVEKWLDRGSGNEGDAAPGTLEDLPPLHPPTELTDSSLGYWHGSLSRSNTQKYRRKPVAG